TETSLAEPTSTATARSAPSATDTATTVPATATDTATAVAVTATTTAVGSVAPKGGLPLRFEQNVGQVQSTDPSAASGVQYVAHGPGYTLWLAGGDAVLATLEAPP